MNKPEKLSVSNLGGGELAALIEQAFLKVGENIADPNVPTEGVRKIKSVISIKPDKKGQSAQIVFKVSTELPGAEPGSATAFIAMDSQSKHITLFNADIRQEQLFSEKEPTVTEIKSVALTAPGPKPAALAPPMKSAN